MEVFAESVLDEGFVTDMTFFGSQMLGRDRNEYGRSEKLGSYLVDILAGHLSEYAFNQAEMEEEMEAECRGWVEMQNMEQREHLRRLVERKRCAQAWRAASLLFAAAPNET